MKVLNPNFEKPPFDRQLEENRLDAEELECIKMWLDKQKVPTHLEGNPLSYIGRIMELIKMSKNV